MLNVGVIGLGNAGNQVAELAAVKAGIEGIAINSSDSDLETVSHVGKLLIGNSEGAGRDRENSKDFLASKIKDLITDENVLQFFENKQVIFMPTSIDGGTGSGATPMCIDVLSKRFPEIIFILVPIYPSLHETSAVVYENSLGFLKEVAKGLPNVTKMSYDNDKYSHLSTDEMMKRVNNEIVEMMQVIRMDYNFKTPYSSIDVGDMKRLITMPGEMACYIYQGFKEADIDNKSIEDHLLDMVKGNSAHVDIERDKIVSAIAVIANIDEELKGRFDTTLPEIKKIVGNEVLPLNHFYVNGEENSTNRVVVIMSGMSDPTTHIEKIKEQKKIVAEREEKLMAKKRKTAFDDEDDVVTTTRINKQKDTSEFSLDDILGKYK